MKIKICLSTILLLITSCLFSQTEDINFRRVSPPGGFSFQAIQSFVQDKYGYIWMGGFNGIIRYDSKQIIRFTSQPENENRLPSNTITSIAIDKKNNIWASTDKGLCKFDHDTQQFNRVRYTYENGSQPNNTLYSIQFDGQDRLWIVDENFSGFLDQKENKLIRITEGVDDLPRLIYHDQNNRLWLGTQNGTVFLIDPIEKRAIKKIDGPGSLARTICTSTSNIWVGYQEHGARMYDLNGNLKLHYSYTEDPEYDIRSASIRKIIRDTRGQIWIGSYFGLFRSVGNKLWHFTPDDYEGLPHNSIFDIYEDIQGGIWIGTWSGGVAFLLYSDNTFTNYRHSKEPGAVSDNMISSFAVTPNGDFFVGTELTGLNKFIKENSYFKQIQVRDKKGVLNIKAMEVDNNGGLWIASAFNGVYYRPQNNQKFIHFNVGNEDGTHVSSRETYALCKTDSGMWIGTIQGGINFYRFASKKIVLKNAPPFKQFKNLSIRTISTDSFNNLWITTLQGLYKIHVPTNKISYFGINAPKHHKTRSETFYFAKQLTDGKIWIGSGGDGAYIYDNKTDTLVAFKANGLLDGKDVYGIINGLENDIWITTNDGLILYNWLKKTSRRFVITDGIQGNLFNPNAIFKDKNGDLYFGGTNGFSRLEPKPIKTNTRQPNILLNSIEANNRKIIPVQTGINTFENIVLGPRETNINFRFTADNYLLPEKNEFKYRLTNYINDWVFAGNNGYANFVNLPSGEYNFEVKACNNDGIWNNTQATIKVVIKKFWYKSTLALILYSLVMLTIILFIVRFYMERLKLKKALLIEKMEHQQEEQLNEMKLRFFTNISHEFRTPLTLINGPVKSLLTAGNLSAEQHNQLDTVKRNTNRLLQLINQIIDLRKVEKGIAKLKISLIEMDEFVNERLLNFREEAKSKNISVQFNCNLDSITIEADEEKLDKIIYNLLSNAFKYTPENGEIIVSLQKNKSEIVSHFSNQLSFGELENEDFIELVVLDNGQGIPTEELPTIFDRFEKGKVENKKIYSTGIGLNLCKDFTLLHRGVIVVQSTYGKGTRFAVKLPAKQKAQKIVHQSHEQVKNIESWNSTLDINAQPKNFDKKIIILVVEDNTDLLNFIVQLLQKQYTVLSAGNGKEGLEVLHSKEIDLVVSDVMMPVMDGFQFCQKIKSQIETSHIPVILLTALSSVENTATGLEKGADAYISKPFDEKILVSQINNLMAQRKRLQESFAKNFITKQPIDIGNLDSYFLNKINTIIENNINNENFTVDKLAEEKGLIRSQLHRKLKQITSYSATEYINMVKIKKATTLLATKNYNVDEVAFKVGFNSHSYFSKCFKKIHGITPKEYVKKLS